MVDYNIIKNTELRLLVEASESIHSLPADKLSMMVFRISDLTDEGETQMIAALRDEREKVAASRKESNVTPVMEMQKIKKSSEQLSLAARGFESELNQAREAAVRQNEGPAENILQSLS